MAPLPPVDFAANRIREMLRQGRRGDAVAAVIAELKKGKAGPQVQAIAADLLKPAPKQPGRPKTEAPQHWYEIGSEVETLIDDGSTYAEAVLKVAKKYGYAERQAQSTVAFYRRAIDEAREIASAEDRK